jgi:integrase
MGTTNNTQHNNKKEETPMKARAYITRDERMAMKEFQGLAKKAAKGTIPTTLSPTIEFAIQEQVQKDPLQAGEKMFTLLAWATGARARELMKLQWKDFHPIPDAPQDGFSLTIPNGNAYALKPNREIPLAEEFTNILQARRNHILESTGATPAEADEFFICCDETNYAAPGDMGNGVYAERTIGGVVFFPCAVAVWIKFSLYHRHAIFVVAR